MLQRSLVLILCTFLLLARPASSPPSPRLSRGCGERSMRGEVEKKKKREKRLICFFTGAAVQLSPSSLPDSLSSSIRRTSAFAVCSSSSSAELFLSACFLSRSQTDWKFFRALVCPCECPWRAFITKALIHLPHHNRCPIIELDRAMLGKTKTALCFIVKEADIIMHFLLLK